MKEICPNCKSERYERIKLHVSEVEYAFIHINKYGEIDLNVCRDCGVVYLKREQFEKINKTRPEEIVGSKEYYYHKYNIKEKEEVEWNKEFGNITRTEKLDLPSWEEFIEMEEFCFSQKNHKQTILRILGTKYLAVETNFERYYAGDLTKENYTLACRKCKELFLGGNNGI